MLCNTPDIPINGQLTKRKQTIMTVFAHNYKEEKYQQLDSYFKDKRRL